VSQGHEAVMEERRVQQLRVQEQEWSMSLGNCEDWVQIRAEVRVIEQEMTRRLHSDLNC
jgi:hypothetical protein